MHVRRNMCLNGHLRLPPVQQYVNPAHREDREAQQCHDYGMEQGEGVGANFDCSGDLEGEGGDEDGPPDVECTFRGKGNGDNGRAELDVSCNASAYAVEIRA